MKKEGGGIEVYQVESRTSEDVVYDVTVVDGAFWTCNCPAYTFTRRCRHAREITAFYSEYTRRWRE